MDATERQQSWIDYARSVTEHIDHMRFDGGQDLTLDEECDRHVKPLDDGLSLQRLAEGFDLTIWGPFQFTYNEPLERCCVVARSVYDESLQMFKFYHPKVCTGTILGKISRDGVTLAEFSNLDGRTNTLLFAEAEISSYVEHRTGAPFPKSKVSGYIDCGIGTLSLMFDRYPGPIDVVCTYEWENR